MPAAPTRGVALYRFPGGVAVRVVTGLDESGNPVVVVRPVLSNLRDPVPVGATVEFTWDAAGGRHVATASYLT
jgi:hypothetical protein